MATVTIVIPCFTAKRWHSLLRAIESAWAQTHPCELIVVVDHNPDLMGRLTAEIGARAVVVPNRFPRGASGARNTGALAASTELIAFLEDDAVAEPTWIENLLRAHRTTPNAVGYGGAVRPRWARPQPRWFPDEFAWAVGSTSGRIDVDVRNVWGGNMLVRRASFLEAGGFRAGFGKRGNVSQPEDTELCIRMSARAQTGARWMFVPDAVVFHDVPAERGTWSFFLRRCWSEGKGKYAMSSLSGPWVEVLGEEARFVRTVMTRGVGRNLAAAGRGDVAGLARTAAIVLGSAAAATGFAWASAVHLWSRVWGADRRAGVIAAPVVLGGAADAVIGRDPTSTNRVARRSSPQRSRAGDGAPGSNGWRLPVLMYHSISGPGHPSADPRAVPVVEFEDQLARLRFDGWAVVGLTEALGLLDAGADQRIVALTFDDGLLDLLNAVEALQRVGARATAYIPTDAVGMRGSGTLDGRPRLSWSDLADLSRRGFEVGSHSMTHRPLDVLPAAEVTKELVGSRQLLEDRLGLPVESFCYPHGYANSRVRREVRQAGYTSACVVGRRIARAGDDRTALPRVEVRAGITGPSFQELLHRGEPGLAPHAKRAAMPVWRITRTVAYRWTNAG
jgi:peptidoglycan/xylan/chitin deacetylase (PgdA/CDA1 family)/GT2 family glycosyltransferase